ncbi:MAG: aldo/keto reductase, partial [Rhizobiaceae bacterium]
DIPGAFLDTARNYGMGFSEQCIGRVLRARGGLPKECLFSTKLDRDFESNRFDGARARDSLHESLETLGLDRIPLLFFHDPEHARSLDEITRPGGALDELFKMRDEEVVDAIGLGAGDVDVMIPILQERDFDVVLTHNRNTLLNRNANTMIDLCVSRGIAVINAGVYAGGIFATGSARNQYYVYQKASDATLAKIRQIENLCLEHNVSLPAAALQYSVNDTRVLSTIIGISRPERIASTQELMTETIPNTFWDDLETLPKDMDNPENHRIL